MSEQYRNFMHRLRQPTEKQIRLAMELGLNVAGKSFRVLSAEISDAIELKSFHDIEKKKLRPGMAIRYIGQRTDMPKDLHISTIAKNGYIYFKRVHKYCRPWDIVVK